MLFASFELFFQLFQRTYGLVCMPLGSWFRRKNVQNFVLSQRIEDRQKTRVTAQIRMKDVNFVMLLRMVHVFNED